MVPTRGMKSKFVEGERVLCYEPDPTKAKVLYDSKVLDIVYNKDSKGKKTVEYLIHFQGWNSSWDRCVCEEFVLKDTAVNRQLQRDLAEKSQLQLGAYLYRKEKKKQTPRKSNEIIGHSSEEGSTDSPVRVESDEGHITTSSSDDDSSTEEGQIDIELTSDLKQLLENDYYMINSSNMLHELPAEPNVIFILEMYFKHFVSKQMNSLEKNNSRYKNQSTKPSLEYIRKSFTGCREFLDGLRIYFDNTLEDLLLYNVEKSIYPTKQVIYTTVTSMSPYNKKTIRNKLISTSPIEDTELSGNMELENNESNIRKKSLRSYQEPQNSNGSSNPSEVTTFNGNKSNSSNTSMNNFEITKTPQKIQNILWTALPPYAYEQQPPPPCLLYGAIHLARLLVKLPELLAASNISIETSKLLSRHLDLFVEYLNDHKEWFQGKYCSNLLVKKQTE